MVALVPISDIEFQALIAEIIPGYAIEKTASGEWPRERSLELAKAALDHLLPQGRETRGNFLFTIRDTPSPENIGTLWMAVRERAGKRIAYIYHISIKPEHRRKGHATNALAALEKMAREMRLSGIALHVFGHNTSAQAMYLNLGYKTTDINMYKPIEPGHA